jgi:hypothetical protein
MLLTGDAPHFMRSRGRGRRRRARVVGAALVAADQDRRPPPRPYLFARDTGAPTRPESGFVDVDVPLDATTTDAG